MTLPASGAISLRDITAELNMPDPDNFDIDMRGLRSHWLADVAGGGASPVLPNDYWGKEGIKLTDTGNFITPTAGVWTFSSKSFGFEYTNRRILCLLAFMEKASLDVPSAFTINVKIGDATVSSNFSPPWWQGGSGNTRFSSVTAAGNFPTGTSGNVVVTAVTNTGLTIANVQCGIKLLSLSNLSLSTENFSSVGSGSTLNDDLNPFSVAADSSVIVHSLVYATGAHSLSISGLTEKGETDLGSNRRLVWGWNTRMAANPTTNISIASTGTINTATLHRLNWTPTPA